MTTQTNFPETDEYTVPLRILIVDDYVDAANTMALLLRLKGHQVQAAYSGASAITLAQSFCPEVVMLDLAMPEMDGFALIKQLKEERTSKEAFFVAVTGFGLPGDEHTQAAGFELHLLKPVDGIELHDLLQAHARLRHQKRAALNPEKRSGTI